MTDKEQHDLFNEVFTRLRETEGVASNLCVRLDNVVEQMKTSTSITDKFLEALDKRRITDEAREAKFWKAIAVLGGALIALALGKDPVKIMAEHYFPTSTDVQHTQVAIPPHNDQKYVYGLV